MTTIMIGVDATARSEDAIAFARRLAHATTTAEFVIASVVPRSAEPGSPARGDAEATVRRMGALLAVDPERLHTTVVAERTPAQGLHELAAAQPAALLVVGSTHTGHIGRVRPGSTGERLLAGAPCAVAVVPYGFRTLGDGVIKCIGVAFDGSAEARVALDAAAAAARALGAGLEVVTVIPSDVYGAPALMSGPSSIVVAEDVAMDIRTDLDTTLAALPPELSREGVVLEGRPWRELAEHSAKLDLVFLGSRGYGPLQYVILGGTGGPLMREAQCPVIALPRGTRTDLAELFDAKSAATA